jgi:cell wall-associated NlpC family hydrolase
MRNKILFYALLLVSTLSLQSCVTNYVVADPAIYSKHINFSANLASVDSKTLAQNKKELINSFAFKKAAEVETSNAILKKIEIAKDIKYSQTIDALLEEAKTYLGTPYRYGGSSRNGIDCSAFVLSVFGAAAGVSLPRVAASQAKEGEEIAKEDLQKGDLIFFSKGRKISHVAIVDEVTEDGEVKFIHSATSQGVSYSSLSSNYWGPKFRSARRVIHNDILPTSNVAQN